MSRVLALDLSLTATGVAYPDGDTHTYKVTTKGDRRLNDIRARVLGDISATRPTHVAIEGPAFGRPQGMHALGQLAGVIYLALHEAGQPYVLITPSTLKKYATGKGNSSKPEVLAAAIRRLGYEGHDDNQADALWLRAVLMDALGEPVVAVPESHRAALAKVDVGSPS